LLSVAVRENPSIKGLKTARITHILNLSADDTQIFLQGDEQSFRDELKIFMEFSKASEVRVYVEKYRTNWLGSQKAKMDTFCPEFNVSWIAGNFQILGITSSLNQNEIAELNDSKQLNKVL